MPIEFKRRPGKTIRTRRALKKYEPKVFENSKKVLILKGQKTSEEINEVGTDLSMLLTPNVKKLAKRNAFHPFEGRSHLEFLGFKNDCSLFAFLSHSKKREHNLVLGRMFDFHVLDMFEFGVVGKDRLDLSDLRALGADSASLGGKPCFVFQGSEFSSDPFFVRLKNFFLDFFKGIAVSTHDIVLTGVDRAIFISLRSASGQSVVAAPDMTTHGAHKPLNTGNAVVCFRQYAVVKPSETSKSASRIDLVDIGPNLDLAVRRCSCADDQQFKQACYMPKEALAQLKSMHGPNVKYDGVGNLRGQLHLGEQNVAKGLALRKFKAHKRGGDDEKRPRSGGEAGEGGEGGDVAEQQTNNSNNNTAAANRSERGAAPKKVRRVDNSEDDGGEKRRQRHRAGQGRAATSEAISNVDM